MFQLKRKSSHDNIQIVSELSPIRTQYSREYCPYIRCQHFQCYAFILHFVPTVHIKQRIIRIFVFCIIVIQRQVTSHLDIRVSAHPVAHPVISRLSRNPRVPCCVRLIIIYYHSLNRNRCYGSWWLRTHRNIRELYSGSWHSPKYGYCCIARSLLREPIQKGGIFN